MSGPGLKPSRLLFRSLSFHRRRHLGALLGAAVATAVLAGALLVGDSMRESLRSLSLARLGRVEQSLVSERPFGEGLAASLGARPEIRQRFAPPAAALLLRASASSPRPDGSGPRLGGVTVIGVGAAGLEVLGSDRGGAPSLPEGRRALVNGRLAGDLGVRAGDPLVLSLESASQAPRDSLAGRREEAARSLRLEIAEVIPDRGPGLFSLSMDQRVPRNVIVDSRELGAALGLSGKANAILLAALPGRAGTAGDRPLLERSLAEAASLEDFGLRIKAREDRGFLQVESEGFQIDPVLEESLAAAAGSLGVPGVVSTYLANTIALDRPGQPRREIPYSTVAALDPAAAPPLGPLLLAGGEPAPRLVPGEILLTTWAAEDLGAGPGDSVHLEYFVVGLDGSLSTAKAEFRVRGVALLSGAADDPLLTPEFPGVTDAERVGDWDPPFPVDLKRIRPKDEEYWKERRATPKAFIALEEARRLWGSRFGSITAFRIGPAGGRTLAETGDLLRDEIRKRLDLKKLGFSFRSPREEARLASPATDFSALFLAFSFFLIAAAALLLGLLWGLGLERRSSEWGILRALGFPVRTVRRFALLEALPVCGAGALLGLGLAPLYAEFLLRGLLNRWTGSMRPPRLDLHVSPAILLYGYAASLLVVFFATALASRRAARSTPRALLAGAPAGGRTEVAARAPSTRPEKARRRARPLGRLFAGVLFLAAGGLVAWPLLAPGGASYGPALFFAAGAAFLSASVLLFSSLLARGAGSRRDSARTGLRRRGAILWLGVLNAGRHPGRSTLTAALMACAAFVVVAAGASRSGEEAGEGDRSSGSGGFSLVATSEVPVYRRLDDPAGRDALGIAPVPPASGVTVATRPAPSPEPHPVPSAWEEVEVMHLRVRSGDDASCLNLYRPGEPRILGAPPELVRRGGFHFKRSLASAGPERENPWLLLDREPVDGARAVIADEATATWVLHLGLGEEITVTDGRGSPARLRLVALLEGSIFQGSLIVGEKDFLGLFPGAGGYRYFLLGGPPREVERIGRALADGLAPYGFDPVPASRILAEFRSVEHAYLETFSLLGGLGLLLGGAGLGAVLYRGAMERRGELALFRALGFRRLQLSAMVLAENGLLVVGGLGAGSLAALLAVSPHLASGSAPVAWARLGLTLAGAALLGLASGGLAIASVLRAPLLRALRQEK